MAETAKILLVDDQPARLLTYEAILSDLGYSLVKAASGRDALARLMDSEFAAILLDVSMPDMDGFETAAMIRAHPRFETTPIIFVTAVHMTDMDQLRGYRVGAVDYVYVPVVPEILRGKVQVLADLHTHRRELQRLNQTLGAANAELQEAHRRLRDENTRELERLNRHLERANADLERSNAQLRREVSEREAAQRELQDAAQRKDEFLAMLAHELRNPLSAVHNAVQVIRLQARREPEITAMSELLGRQVGHLARLVDDLLDVSRVSTGRIRLRKARVDVIDIVQRAIEMSQPAIRQRQQTLEWSPAEGPVWIEGDSARLIQVVDNLLRNASQYTGAGGRIVISLHPEQRETGAMAVLRVTDTGIGIPQAMLDRVFDLFLQVTPSFGQAGGGLGIGLSLVRALVEMHGGRVVARSDGPGTGSEFVVELPLRPDRPSTVERLAGSSVGSGIGGRQRLRILVVDDNADSVDALAQWLRIEGHTVEVAYSGEQALTLARANAPDMAILDLALPGIDGYEVARTLRREQGPDPLYLVAMTGFGAYTDRERAREAGFDRHLVKPVDYDVFSRILQEVAKDPAPESTQAPARDVSPAQWPGGAAIPPVEQER